MRLEELVDFCRQQRFQVEPLNGSCGQKALVYSYVKLPKRTFMSSSQQRRSGQRLLLQHAVHHTGLAQGGWHSKMLRVWSFTGQLARRHPLCPGPNTHNTTDPPPDRHCQTGLDWARPDWVHTDPYRSLLLGHTPTAEIQKKQENQRIRTKWQIYDVDCLRKQILGREQKYFKHTRAGLGHCPVQAMVVVERFSQDTANKLGPFKTAPRQHSEVALC